MRKIVAIWLCLLLMFSSTIVGTNVDDDIKFIGDSENVIANDPSLVGEWRFDEGFGQFVNDTSGNGNNGTLMPSYPGDVPGWMSGIKSTALQFDGLNDHVLVPDDASLDITDEITIAAWMKPAGDSSRYQKQITISNPGSLLTDYQINLTVDYVPGKMNSDFSDLRFYNSTGAKLTSWVESQIASTIANVWVEVPSIPAGDSTIYMYYGDPAATHEITWSGTITLPATGFPSGWLGNIDLFGRFPRGNNTYGGIGGSTEHDHTYSGTTDVGVPINIYLVDTVANGDFSPAIHTHTFAGTTDTSNHLPSYREVSYMSNTVIPFDLDNNLIVFFDTASLPAGWSRLAELDDYFPRGGMFYGLTGGSSTHTHTFSGAVDPDFSSQNIDYVPFVLGNASIPGHSHAYSGTAVAASSLPPYLNVIFAQPIGTERLPYDMIAIFDSMPPMGWSYFSPLHHKFPRGNATFGGTGGSETHDHTCSGNTLASPDLLDLQEGFGVFLTHSSHTHAMSCTTDVVSNMPPYFNVIFAKRNSVNVNVSVGLESDNGVTKAGAYNVGANQTTAFGKINDQTISTNITPGWNYVVQTYNGSAQCLYVNGYLKATQPLTGLINTNANDLIIGDLFEGIMDEVSIWDRALNATEVDELFKSYPHFPIRINSNADFDRNHGVVNWATGDGSASHPWIIEGYDINGTGYGYCIYVGNTTEHFIISDCTLQYADGNPAYYYWNSGLVLHKVLNGTIEGNNIYSNEENGIYIGVGCKNNTISDNNITSNGENGIYLAPSGVWKLTDNSNNDYESQINNAGEVVWYCSDGIDNEIFLWDGTSTLQITNNAYNDIDPQINDAGEVVWEGYDGTDWEIFLWDGVTTAQITDNSYDDEHPQINDPGEVVWMGYDINYEIFFWDGTTTTQVTNTFWNDFDPQINDKGEVTWYYYDGSDYEIFFWDGITTTQITNNANSDWFPQINNNGEVAWHGSDGTDNEIFFWDGITTTQVTSNSNTDQYPQINDNGEVVWMGSDGGWEIFFWDGVTTTQITNNANNDQAPQINDNGDVVWQASDGSDYEIFLWDGTTTTHITDDTYTDDEPQINNKGEVVWPGYDGNDREIYIYYGQETIQNIISDNNISWNTNSGILFKYCTNHTISNNTLTYNKYGIFSYYCNNQTITNNTISYNVEYGILFIFSSINTITYNQFSFNFYGICSYNSNLNTINYNSVTSNIMHGIYIFSGCVGNLIYHNSFINNSNQAEDLGINFWNNVYPVGGNYWSDYIGVDDNSTITQDVPPPDGFGDTPYWNIGGVGPPDDYPLMKPSGHLDVYPPEHFNEFPMPGDIRHNETPIISVIIFDTSGIDASSVRLYINNISVFYSLEQLPTGYNVSYWHESGFNDGETVTCRIVAEDIYGNQLNYTWNFTIGDMTGPDYSNEYPPDNGTISDPTPTISVHVTDTSGVNSSTIRLYVQGFSVFYTLTPITDGYNVSYYYDAGFSPGEVVTCRIVAEDIYGNHLDFTWEFSVAAKFETALVAGWNLVSIPLVQSDTTILSVLASIEGKWDIAQSFDANTGNWPSYGTFKPPSLNDLTDIDHKMAFWLHTTEACTLIITGTPPTSTDIQLYSGWNLVSYPSLTPTTIATALAGTGYDAVEGFNATHPYRITPLSDSYLMQPGEGYWVHVPADTIWVVDW